MPARAFCIYVTSGIVGTDAMAFEPLSARIAGKALMLAGNRQPDHRYEGALQPYSTDYGHGTLAAFRHPSREL
jgi:hypothetical protein